MTDYISTPISVLNDDLNAVQTTLEAKADKSEITAFITEDALSDYATETYVQEYVAEHGGGSVDISACLSSAEFTSDNYLPANPFGELDISAVSLEDLGNKINKILQLLKRDKDGPGGADPTKTYAKYLDGSISEFNYSGKTAALVFGNQSNVVNVKLGNAITALGGYAFANCSNLTSVTIPDSITDLGTDTFLNCGALSTLVIPNSVSAIPYQMCRGCGAIKSFTVPSSVTSIGVRGLPAAATVTFEGKTMAEVQAMDNFRWGIETDKIVCTDGTL